MLRTRMTHAGSFDDIGDLGEKLLILLRIFAPDQDFQRNLATLQWLQMLSCQTLALKALTCDYANNPPFFAVVTT